MNPHDKHPEPPSGLNNIEQPERPIASQTLFRGRREVVITHNGRTYRLRITQNGKLILNA